MDESMTGKNREGPRYPTSRLVRFGEIFDKMKF